ncbi:MAG: C40 family peptidase, partial [Acidimicrobiales bacterium]
RQDDDPGPARDRVGVRGAQLRQLRVPVDEAPPGSAVPPPPGAATAIAEARRQLGKPYEYGSPGPDSFDCSGLTSWAWRAGGKALPHSSRAQMGITTRIPVGDIQPGDLVFYGSPVHHVGLYAGNGQMVEASETGTPVRMASIYRRDLVGVGRVK